MKFTEHAAGASAGRPERMLSTPKNLAPAASLATVNLKLCPGWRFDGHIGHAPHTLPGTLEYFHRSEARVDGLNGQCKACGTGYRQYRTQLWNEQRAARKARNEAGAVDGL